MVASKDMAPLPKNFLPVFINNQFRVKIELPTRPKFPSLTGKTAIITGANTGLGFESARQLLSLGLSHLIVAVRSVDKGQAAAAKLRQANASATVDVWALDMESYASIRAFVNKCEQELPRIDIAILNAGLSLSQFSKSQETGHETSCQVNHYGTALLTVILLPVLKAKSNGKEPARLTLVNSIMSHLTKFTTRDASPLLPSFDDAEKFDGSDRYGSSKLLNQFFTVELVEHVRSDDVVINMVDPGLTRGTGLFREVPAMVSFIFKGIMALVARPVDRGAATYVHAVALLGKESHGCFLMNAEVAPYVPLLHLYDIWLTLISIGSRLFSMAQKDIISKPRFGKRL